MNNPLISVCIPLYDTEPFLEQCLRSVITQDFDSFEIVIVSDASRGCDGNGRNAKKIVRLAEKECKKIRKEKNLPSVSFRFIEHRENRGLIEVRRTLAYEAKGLYLTQVDSDDEMAENALNFLYSSAQKYNSDITHGTSTAGIFDDNGNFTPCQENRYGKIYYGLIKNDVLKRWLLDSSFTANTRGKLIRRELFIKAYENIPYTQCNMADDVLLFFFIGLYAKSYVGIEEQVYRYRVNTGMSSARKIDSLKKWSMICSTASVFSIISEWIKNNEKSGGGASLSEEEINSIRRMTTFYLANNLKQLSETVIPELQLQAREMLCEYWGASFVERVELSFQN